MLRKNRTKHNAFWLFILILPLVLFSLITQLERRIFILNFSPINVATTARVEDETLVFDTIGQSLSITSLHPNRRLRVAIYISGFFIVNERPSNDEPILMDGASSPYGAITELSSIGWYHLSSHVSKDGEFSLIMGNFAILLNEEFTYGFYLSELILYQREL